MSAHALRSMAAIRDSLRHARLAARLSQGELAASLGIERETLNRRENAGVLDINLVDLLVWIDRLGGEMSVTFNVTERPRRLDIDDLLDGAFRRAGARLKEEGEGQAHD